MAKNLPTGLLAEFPVEVVRDAGLILRLGRSSKVFMPGKSHGQKSLAGYSPWGFKELDSNE